MLQHSTKTNSTMVFLSSSFRAVNVQFSSKALILSLSILVLQLSTTYSQYQKPGNHIKSATWVSEKIEVGPGSCSKKDYFDIKFPKGHIAIKSFDGELIDEKGNSVPLHEAYLHHWFVMRYFENITMSRNPSVRHNKFDGLIFKRNNGACSNTDLPQYWGLGTESRGTTSNIPDPFAIEVGNPTEIPDGHEEKWMLNIMVIDTRGVQDREGCIECRCNLYNVTKDLFGQPLQPDYKGGFLCCYDNTQCKLREGFQGLRRTIYLRYTISWVDWDQNQVPVKIYILDVTDQVSKSNGTHYCQVEYTIPANNGSGSQPHVKKANISMEKGGYLIYSAAHQHIGGVSATLYGQDGRTLCTSTPKYGTGKEVGNEKGYVVGMSVCYPEPGSVKINNGETLTIESKYNSSFRTGAMGQFYILVAEQLQSMTHIHNSSHSHFA